jgi:DNA-binding transcriptional MerR regulator
VTEVLLPIGQFARLCRLSVKQLRHYAELGLLQPAHVDPATGYRYFRRDQAREALSIGLLRSLDLPLATIAGVLGGADPTDALRQVRARLEADVLRRTQMIGTLDRLLSAGLPDVPVRVVREPARRVAAVRESGPPERIAEITSACIARLIDAVTASGQPLKHPLIGLFPLDFTEQLTVAAVIEIEQDAPGTSTELLPGGPHACATHVGPYDQIQLTAHALLAWCADRGHAPSGPVREVYLNDPHTTEPDQLVTHLMITLEES